MTKRLFHGLSVVLLAAVSALAEQPITVQIPFSFHVGNSILPAGSYRFDTDVASGVLRMRSNDCKSVVMAIYNHAQLNAPSRETKFIFHKYSDHYFLYQVWNAGRSEGTQLPRSRREAEIVSTGHRSIQASLAAR